jgi:FixJ family two-component response regulator
MPNSKVAVRADRDYDTYPSRSGDCGTNSRAALRRVNVIPTSASDRAKPRPNAEMPPLVYICDHDFFSARKLASTLDDAGLETRWFASSSELLAGIDDNRNACVISEVRLAGSNGIYLQSQLKALRRSIPVILMTATPNVSMAVTAMKAGAIDFLAKPANDQAVLNAVLTALAKDADRRRDQAALGELKHRFDSLSKREQQVLTSVVSGALNKQIAAELEITEVTVKLHRGSMMRKMGAQSVADIVRKWEALIRSV